MRHGKSDDDFTADVMKTLKAHFGDTAKAYWVDADPLCPCCSTQEIDGMIFEGKRAMSVNAFMFREKGVLIGYFLCGDCAMKVLSHKGPGKSELHNAIERNLVAAYQRYLGSLDA